MWIERKAVPNREDLAILLKTVLLAFEKLLSFKSIIEIPTLTYAFYIRENALGKIEIYGHENEETKYLTISLVDSKADILENTHSTELPVMWVSKVIDVKDEKIIFNNLSLIKWDTNNQFNVVLSATSEALIDLEFNEKNESYYLLLGDYENMEFKINKLNSNFKITDSTDLNEKLIPTELLLPNK